MPPQRCSWHGKHIGVRGARLYLPSHACQKGIAPEEDKLRSIAPSLKALVNVDPKTWRRGIKVSRGTSEAQVALVTGTRSCRPCLRALEIRKGGGCGSSSRSAPLWH